MHSQPLQVFKHSFVQMAVAALFILAALPGRVKAQQNNAAASPTVPQVIEYNGQFSGTVGGVPSGTVSITFTLYENEQGGTALWSETQNVQVDAQGHYTALLGSASPEGLPMNLFTTVQAHWLAVQPLLEGFGEQPRVLLVSAPYALKAGDAETVGGLPPSAFVRAASGTPSSSSSGSSGSSGLPTRASLGGPTGQPVPPPVTGTGTKNYIPIWSTTTKLGNSKLYQTAAGNVGLGTITPAATLEVNGTAQFDNTITFAAGQTFPGTGTITGVTAGTGLSGGGTSGSVMLNIASNACGSGAALTALPFTCTAFASLGGNSFSGNQNVTGNVTASGTVTGGTVNALQNYALNGIVVIDEPGSALNLALGSGALGIDQSLGYGGYNTAVGTQALYNNTASGNTASGYQALYANTNGGNNTASGAFALYSNVGGTSPQGSFNTASGANALYSNTTGSENTATGDAALYSNTTGSNNLADGYEALLGNTLGNDNTATGVQALYSNTGEGNYQGGYNTASGYQALYSNTQGGYNTAMGVQALYKTNDNAGIGGILNTGYGYQAGYNITSGQANIAIGGMAANNVSGGNNNNIESFSSSFCSSGFGFAPQTSFFVAGVRGVTTGQNNAVDVVIDSNGQLGTVSSSRRFKEDIHDMGDASYGLMRLRPVTFRYKKPFDDGSKPIQYGLIAEEVAEVYPDLVARSADGQIETVKYQLLDPMLLNEVQRQHGEIRDQKALVLAQQNQLKAQQALVHEQQIQLKTQQTQIAELLSSVKTIQASLHTRRGRGHAGLTSAKGAPAPATTAASLPLAPSARGGN
jgi:hypothetical protein